MELNDWYIIIIHIRIVSTPYAVLSLFATSFAACPGGIRVYFMTKYLLNWYMIIYKTDLFLIQMKFTNMFLCICNMGWAGTFIENLLRFQHRSPLLMCLCISRMPSNSGGNMQKRGSGPPGKIYLGLILLKHVRGQNLFHNHIMLHIGLNRFALICALNMHIYDPRLK